MAELLAELTAEGIRSRALEVSHALHSARLDPMLDAFERRAAQVVHAVPRIPLLSNVTGKAFEAGTRPDAAYWRRHARGPVRFAANVEALSAAGVTVLVEVGPHPTLLGLAGRSASTAKWTTAGSLRRGRDDRREMLSALATVYARGAAVKWDAVMPAGARRIALPTYPFQRERHWVEQAPRRSERVKGHPLLGERRELAGNPGTHVWEQEIGLLTHPWLGDHRVQDTPIVPASAYIEMALRAMSEITGEEAVTVRDIENRKPMLLQDDDMRRVQATLVTTGDGVASFRVHSRAIAGGAWTEHMTATVASGAVASEGIEPLDLGRQQASGVRELDGRTFYAALAAKGNQWGPCFQGLERAWIRDGQVIGRVTIAGGIARDVAAFQFHPALSDSCGHALVATVALERDDAATGGAFVGGGVGEVHLFRRPRGRVLWARATRRTPPKGSAGNLIFGDVAVFDEDGTLINETTAARLWYLDAESRDSLVGAPPDWFHAVTWEPADSAGPGSPAYR